MERRSDISRSLSLQDFQKMQECIFLRTEGLPAYGQGEMEK